LFTEGKSVSKYPLRLVYKSGIQQTDVREKKLKWAFLVSKKNFKKAVDRNYFKRVLRETYRLNKHYLLTTRPTVFFMFFYQTKDRLSYEEINTKPFNCLRSLLLKIVKNQPQKLLIFQNITFIYQLNIIGSNKAFMILFND
jgi:ribonuclease P protein component